MRSTIDNPIVRVEIAEALGNKLHVGIGLAVSHFTHMDNLFALCASGSVAERKFAKRVRPEVFKPGTNGPVMITPFMNQAIEQPIPDDELANFAICFKSAIVMITNVATSLYMLKYGWSSRHPKLSAPLVSTGDNNDWQLEFSRNRILVDIILVSHLLKRDPELARSFTQHISADVFETIATGQSIQMTSIIPGELRELSASIMRKRVDSQLQEFEKKLLAQLERICPTQKPGEESERSPVLG